MSNKKQNKKEAIDPTTTPEELEKLIKTGGFISEAQAVALGLKAEIPLTGTINHSNVNNTALPPNVTTAISKNVNESLGHSESKDNEKNIDFNLNLDFGKKGGKLASQLKAQGFVLNKQDIKNCESIRTDLLAMEHVKVLKKKEVRKAFERVTEQIGRAIVKKYFGDNVTMRRIK